MTPDQQEALSRAHGRDVIVVLPLRSGNLAIYNAKRELCGILAEWNTAGLALIYSIWFPPSPFSGEAHPIDLKELGLL